MTDDVAPDFAHLINAGLQASECSPCPEPLKEGELAPPVFVNSRQVSTALRLAARQGVGLLGSPERKEVVWVQGDRELAVSLAGLEAKLADGLIHVQMPVRCDQTGATAIEVVFAVGTDDQPSGLYASAYRRPNGPPLIVEAWGETLVAFAWQCILGMVTGIAGAVGRDTRGQILVPVELTASHNGIQIVPMARHRFTGSAEQPPKYAR